MTRVIAGSQDPAAVSVPARRRRRQLRLVRDLAGPVVRWAGGKTKLLDEIVPRLPSAYGTYFEPFCGGLALFFRLQPRRAVVSDVCEDLIECYLEIARDPGEVHRELGRLTAGRPLEMYYTRRAAWNESRTTWSAPRRAATFLYLNKSCYNGLYRVNAGGHFNVPVGKFGPGGGGDPSYPSLADLLAASEALRRAEICCQDYQVAFDRAVPGDLVYVDSPYPPRSKTSSFSAYTSGGFGEEAQRTLASRVSDLVARGVSVVVSQADVPLTREIYASLRLHQLSAPRSVNSDGGGRGRVPELLLTGGAS